MSHLSNQPNYINYNNNTNEIYILSLDFKIYFGLFNIQKNIDEQKYIIESEYATSLIPIDNLEIFIAFGYNNGRCFQIYEKNSGSLIREICKKYYLYFIKSYNLIFFQEDDVDSNISFSLYKLDSIWIESREIFDKNQSILPLLCEKKEGFIIVTTIESHLYMIYIQQQQVKFISKRSNNIKSVHQISNDIYLVQGLYEIVFLNSTSLQIITENRFINRIDILNFFSFPDQQQNLNIMYAEYPNKICMIQSVQYIINQDQQLCTLLDQSIYKIIIVNKQLNIITNKYGYFILLNPSKIINASGQPNYILNQRLYFSRYEIIMLTSYYTIVNSIETHYFLSYSIDKNLSFYKFSLKQDDYSNASIDLLQNFKYVTKFSQVTMSSDQKSVIICLLNNMKILRIFLDYPINQMQEQYQMIYFLPFMKQQYQVKLYENIGCLLVFINYIYVIFDFQTTLPIFISTTYQKNIYDIELIDKEYIAFSTGDEFQIHKLDYELYQHTSQGLTKILYQSSKQYVKIFSVQIYNIQDQNNDIMKMFYIVGYSQISHEIIFTKIPIIEKEKQYQCKEVFENSNYQIMEQKLFSLDKLNSNMTEKVTKYTFEFILNQQQKDNQNKYYQINQINIPKINPNIPFKLKFSGQRVQLDQIDFSKLISYNYTVEFSDATIYIFNSTIIRFFTKVLFRTCVILIHQFDEQKIFDVQFEDVEQLEMDDIKIIDYIYEQSVSIFQGFKIKNSVQIQLKNWKIEGNTFENVEQLIEIKNAREVYISQFSIQNNGFKGQNNRILQIYDVMEINILKFSIQNSNFIGQNNQILQIQNVGKVDISQFSIQNNNFKGQNNHILQIQKVQNLKLDNGQLINNKNILNLETVNFYLFTLQGVNFTNITNTNITNNKNFTFLDFQNKQTFESSQDQRNFFYNNSQLNMDNITCKDNINSQQIIYSFINLKEVFNFTFTNSDFKKNKLESNYIIFLNKTNEINIKKCNFTENLSLSCIYATQGESINLVQSTFSLNNSPDKGSCLAIVDFKQNPPKESLIDQCGFKNNMATNYGGAFYLENTDIDITNSSFTGNYAAIGGAIRYIGVIPKFVIKLQSKRILDYKGGDIVFSENKAAIFGQNYGSIPSKLVANYNNMNISIEELKLVNMRSGSTIENLKIYLQDEESNYVNFIYQKQQINQEVQDEFKSYMLQAIVLDETQLIIKGTYIFPLIQKDGYFNLDGMILVGIPNNDSFYNLYANFIRRESEKNKQKYIVGNNFTINVNFRQCKVGELYQQVFYDLYECFPCSQINQFSVKKPEKNLKQFCKKCPNEVIACNTSDYKIKQGYWRKSIYDDIILECYNKHENCYGKEQPIKGSEFQNYCVRGYIVKDHNFKVDFNLQIINVLNNITNPLILPIELNIFCSSQTIALFIHSFYNTNFYHTGPLCEVCDNYGEVWYNERYGSTDSFTCSTCNSKLEIAIKLAIQMIFASFYLAYSVKKSIDKASRYIICQTLRRLDILLIGKTGEKDLVSFYIKLTMHFIQMTSVISNVKQNFLKFSFFQFFGVVGSPQQVSSNSLDCVLASQDSIPVEFFRAIWNSFQPFVFLLLILSVYVLIFVRKLKRPEHKRFFYALYTFGFVQFQSGTVAQLVLVISCIQIGTDYYIKAQTNKQCYSDEHLRYTLILVLPLLLFWIFVMPLLILWRIRQIKSKLTEPIQVYKYGFMYSEYKKKYYYWEFMRIILRLLVLMVGNIFPDSFVSLKLFISIMYIMFYNFLLNYLQPYSNKESKDLDYFFNYAIIILYLLYIVQMTNQESRIQDISAALQFLIQAVCYISLFYLIVSFTLIKNDKVHDFLVKRIPCMGKCLQKRLSSSLRRFILWKKIKLHFDDFVKGKEISYFALQKFNKRSKQQQNNQLLQSNNRKTPSKSIFGKYITTPKEQEFELALLESNINQLKSQQSYQITESLFSNFQLVTPKESSRAQDMPVVKQQEDNNAKQYERINDKSNRQIKDEVNKVRKEEEYSDEKKNESQLESQEGEIGNIVNMQSEIIQEEETAAIPSGNYKFMNQFSISAQESN